MTATAEAPEAGPGVVYQGVIAIEWPAPRPGYECAPMPAWKAAVFDALSGKQIFTVSRLEIHVAVNDMVTADVTMHTDDLGRPHYGSDGDSRIWLDDDGKVREETFPFLVAGMRVREP